MNKRFTVFVLGAGVAMAGSLVGAQEIETFDTPNTLQNTATGTTFQFTNDTGSFRANNGATYSTTPIAPATTPPALPYYEISTHPGTANGAAYGSGYHNIFTDDNPPAGATASNGVVDISHSNTLQLDVTINNGTDAGLFVDLLDGEGDFYKYFFGFDLTGNATVDNANALNDQFVAGETVMQGSLPNEEILDVPLATPFFDINGTNTFDFTQLTLFRIENDPNSGTPAALVTAAPFLNNPSDVSFYNLSAVNTPEPASLGFITLGCMLIARRRRQH